MDPSRGDSRYNLNYSMSSIGLSLADQADMYGNPAAVAALGGRPPSAGLLQGMSGGVGGSNVGLASRSSNLMTGAPQCQSLSNNSSGHSSNQQRGLKRSGSDCYDDPHHRVGNTGGTNMNNMQSIDNCVASGNLSHSGQQQQSALGVGAAEAVDDGYNALQNKKSPPANGKKTKGRVKIKMEYIDNKLRRYTTFSKRKTGIMKKAYELSTLTGTQVMLLVASETGHVYTFATRKLQPMITSEAGKQLIQTCLNSPDPPSAGGGDQRMSATGFEETELSYNITDEDSKDIRSPLSSGNDSEDSSDIEGIGTIQNIGASNDVTSLATAEKILNKATNNCDLKSVENQSSSLTDVDLAPNAIKQLPTVKRKLMEPKDIIIPPPSANITQDVLLKLIESGHLQVHTEEDGSGHQYVAIPLSPATAEIIQSNKISSNATLQAKEKRVHSSSLKGDSYGINIKEELE